MPDIWDQFPDAKVTEKRAADMWDQFSDAKPTAKPTKTIYDLYPRELENQMGIAATAGASDAQLGDVVQKTLGDKVISRTATPDGYEILKVRAPDGSEQDVYLNKPGLDTQDVVRGVRGALPYMLTGGAAGLAGRGAGVLANSLLQGGAAALTSAVGDLAQEPMGSQQGIEGGKALITGALGAAGPVLGKAVGSAYQRFIAEPRYFDRSSGALTDLGKQVAQDMGLDPATMAREAQQTFAKSYAADPAAAQGLIDSGKLDFNVPVTKGQLTKDPQQLMIEKSLRSGVHGETAKNTITALDQEQAAKLAEAARQTLPQKFVSNLDGYHGNAQFRPTKLGNEPLAPDQFGSVIQDTFQGAKSAAQAAEDKAWDGIGVLRATPQALENLPNAIRSSLEFKPDNTLHPATWRMLEQLDAFTKGNKSGPTLDILGPNNAGDLDTFRRQLGALVKAAPNPADRTLAGNVYRSFNNWIGDSAQQQLLLGNADDAARLVAARDVSKQMHEIFAPTIKGRQTSGARVVEKILNQDTPEKIIDTLFASPKAGVKDGTVEALLLMKRAAGQYADQAASTDLWTSLKVAYWSKLIQGKDGQVLSPTNMLNNINSALHNQPTVVQTLFSKSDLKMINRFANTLKDVAYKDPNPSGTATGIAVLSKQLFGKLLNAFGPIGQAAVEYSGIPRAWGTALAKRAVAQTPQAIPAQGVNLGPLTAGAGSAVGRR